MSNATQNKGARKLLGQMLIEAGLIDEIQLTVALGAQKQSGLRIGKQLLKLGFVEEGDLALFLKDDSDMGVPLLKRTISPEALKAVPEMIAFEYKVIPLALVGKTLVLAVHDPADIKVIDELSFKLGKNIHPVRAFEWDIESALLKFYKGFSDDELSMLTNVSSAGEQYANAQWSFGDQVLLDEPTIKEEPTLKKEPAKQPSSPAPKPSPTPLKRPAAKPAQPQVGQPQMRQRPASAPAAPAMRPTGARPQGIEPTTAEVETTDNAWESLLDQMEHTSHAWDNKPIQKSRAAKIISDAAVNLKKDEILEAMIDLLIDKKLLTEKEILGKLKSLGNNR